VWCACKRYITLLRLDQLGIGDNTKAQPTTYVDAADGGAGGGSISDGRGDGKAPPLVMPAMNFRSSEHATVRNDVSQKDLVFYPLLRCNCRRAKGSGSSARAK